MGGWPFSNPILGFTLSTPEPPIPYQPASPVPTRQRKFSLDYSLVCVRALKLKALTQIREYHHVGKTYFRGIYRISFLYISDISPMVSKHYPRPVCQEKSLHRSGIHHKCCNTLHRVTSKLSVSKKTPRREQLHCNQIRYAPSWHDWTMTTAEIRNYI